MTGRRRKKEDRAADDKGEKESKNQRARREEREGKKRETEAEKNSKKRGETYICTKTGMRGIL